MKIHFSRGSFRRRWPPLDIRVTRGGIFFLLGMLLIGLAALDSDSNLLMLLLGLCGAAVLLSAFSGWRTLRGLSVTRMAPELLVAGQPAVFQYSITNRRAWGGVRGVHIEDVVAAGARLQPPEGYAWWVGPGERTVVTAPVLPRVRGRVGLTTIRVSTRFPFAIFTKSVRLRSEQEVVVFPALGRLLSEVTRRYRARDSTITGAMQIRTSGDEEYYGVREYRPGDNPRRIHWRRTAQTGQLMIREMARTRDDQFWCVVDTRVDPRHADQRRRLETVISAAATVVCDALEKGAKIGLICNGEPLVVLPPGGGRAHRPRLLRELAIREPNAESELAPHLRGMSWPARWRGSCLLLGTDNTEDFRASAAALRQAVGPTRTYIAGTADFSALYVDADESNEDGATSPEAGGAEMADTAAAREMN